MLIAAATPDAWEIASIIAAAVSIALAVFAIWQASTFYKWSNQTSKNVEKASDEIASSVRKLEDLFSRLYSDTFGMMRDTVSDMRKHMWPASSSADGAADKEHTKGLEEVEKRTAANVARVREEMMSELRSVVAEVGATSAQVADLENQLGPVLDRTIERSREAEEEAVQSTVERRLRDRIEELFADGRREIEAEELLRPFFDQFGPDPVHRALVSLREKKIVEWKGRGPVSGPDVSIRLSPR